MTTAAGPGAALGQGAYTRGVILALLSGVAMSSMGVGLRLIEDASLWVIVFHRSLAMTLFLALLILWRGGSPLSLPKGGALGGVIGGLGLTVANICGLAAVQETTVANALLLFSAAPLAAAALGWLLLGEKPRPLAWAAMAIAVIGVTVMVADSVAIGGGRGELLALVAALGFTAFALALRRWRQLDMIGAAFLAGVFTAVVSGAMVLASGEPALPTPRDWALSVALGVFQIGLGMALFTAATRHVPAAEAALLALSEVILGPLWVWLLFSETMTLGAAIGGAILFFGLGLNAVSGVAGRRAGTRGAERVTENSRAGPGRTP